MLYALFTDDTGELVHREDILDGVEVEDDTETSGPPGILSRWAPTEGGFRRDDGIELVDHGDDLWVIVAPPGKYFQYGRCRYQSLTLPDEHPIDLMVGLAIIA